ncbi:Uncharacterised protein [Actinomyces bovis]|uniref:DUF4350 domain-containing protein n=1 Tax=Actinomyces bovis TaxID=1658 RepID=A0ABY1VMW5_9ACTO|nr:DUF4350 domain-containing protein [Actinomyces bovis]SPT53330.1 Uncharacterised protein [Actinomyces bovis]VEG52685.1 Uncharacterised protein [Actinomyces israelii]
MSNPQASTQALAGPPTDTVATASAPPAGSAASQSNQPTIRERLRRARPVVLALLLLAVVTLMTSSSVGTGSKVPLALDNIKGDGARGLGEVLRSYGIRPYSVQTIEQAMTAVSSDPHNTTLALVGVGSLTDADREVLTLLGADITVVGTTYQDLTGMGPLQASGQSAPAGTALSPSCDDADAQAAQALDGSRGSVTLPKGATAPAQLQTCFPVGTGFAYASMHLPAGGTLRLIGDASIATNAKLAQSGNAALMVRALGHHKHVVWFDAEHPGTRSVWDAVFLPRWAPVLMALLCAAAGVLALAKGRRMGRLVREDLPVEVPAAETTIGLGRMYQQAKDREHAARALRIGAALRLGRRLGLAPSADGAVLLDELARRCGTQEGPALRARADLLLYGPPPSNDQELTALADQLDQLESEVQHR